MERRFSIIGAGMGQPESLTGQAREALLSAELALSTPRLAQSLSPLREIVCCPTGQIAQTAIDAAEQQVAIVVSGDPGFFSLARSLRDKLAAYGSVMILCGQSSMQYFCARIGTAYDDVLPLSLHGRSGNVLGAVCYHPKVFVLTGGEQTAQSICRTLRDYGLGAVRISLGENLGAPEERILYGTAAEIADMPCGNLAVLLIENGQAVDAGRALRDSDFLRGDTPMTKQEVRWTAVNLLRLRETDTAYDVGAGTGSVAFEMARRAHRGVVYAIERKPDALSLIRNNRVHLGGYNVLPIEGVAPTALEALPSPNAVFLGGSGGQLYEILSQLKERSPWVRVVITAIALETLAAAQDAMQRLGFTDCDVCQINASRGRKIGGYTMMMANNPVFLLSGGGRDGK